MPEQREGHDPPREAEEIAEEIIGRINEKSAADRLTSTAHRLRTGGTTAEERKISRETAEARRDDKNVPIENQERTKSRKKCFDAIIVKLEQRGIRLPDTTKIILAKIMERTQGEWNQYDGDPEGVDLGKVDFDPSTQTITIRFECSWGMIGERIITLART